MPSVGLWELVFIFLIVLVIFGPKALPKIGSALGKGIRDFKDAAKGISTDLEEDDRSRRPIDHSAPRESITSVPRDAVTADKPDNSSTTQV